MGATGDSAVRGPAVTRLDGRPRLRRFDEHQHHRSRINWVMKPDSPAAVEGHTRYRATVIDPADAKHILISGMNSKKIGQRVTKGPWAGMPIYTLTLEERATCPRSCHHWHSCYGNQMHFARRLRHGEDLEWHLRAELAELQRQHRRGFVVRLHVLGDFYDLHYLRCWIAWLDRYPALRIFGYTAHLLGTEIGDEIAEMRDLFWPRFAIRTSAPGLARYGAATVPEPPPKPRIAEGIVCPQQTGKTECCGTCGLCWGTRENIVFIQH